MPVSAMETLATKYQARLSLVMFSDAQTLVVHLPEPYDWLALLEDVQKIDSRYELGKMYDGYHTFQIALEDVCHG